MGFLAIVAVAQFLYCVLAGNYPFNAFLSGFCAAVGQFVLTASLRMQTSGGNGGEGKKEGGKAGGKGKSVRTAGEEEEENGGEISHERFVFSSRSGWVKKDTNWCRAFADYVFGSVILHFFCVNFIN